MNKKNIKDEKKVETKEVNKVELKKTSSFKKKKKVKKKYYIWYRLCLLNF